MAQRVLVTGGTGVIASWVTRGLVESGVTPVVFARGSAAHIGQAINGDLADELIDVRGDLLDQGALATAVRDHQASAIVHMASIKPWQIEEPFVKPSRPREAVEQVALATLNVLEVAREQGVRRVVYASSKAVFGPIHGGHGAPQYAPLPEEHPRLPEMLYGIGKVAAEDLGRYFAAHYDVEFTAIRFASSYGPLRRGPAPIETAIRAAAENQPVQLAPHLDGQRDDYVYCKDVAASFVLAALCDTRLHWAYNIGSGRTFDHQDWADALRNCFPEAELSFADEEQTRRAGMSITDRARCLMDIERARRDLGYEPRYARLEDGIADYVAEEKRVTARASA